MSDDELCISKHVKFSDISAILEKLKSATDQKKHSKRDDILRRYFESFEQFRREFRSKTGNNARSSIFPILRFLLPAADRERDSYGLRFKSLQDLYIKLLGISETSIEARRLAGYDETGTGSGGGDFADRIFTLMRGRCPQECQLTVWDVNQRLDAIGEHYQNSGRRGKIQDELIRLVEGLTQLDQKWLIRIILKNLRLGLRQQKILALYHPKAGMLFDRYSNLSQVCDMVENGTGLEELNETNTAVKLFQPVKPMLCQRIDLKLVDGLLKKEEFWLETKMDGERFQLHKEGPIFKYFSRNTYEYSNVFGSNSNHPGATLTPFLTALLSSTVHSVILDGEMMVFDKTELTYRDKSENTDVKGIKADNPILRPCFCVYDILFLNGRSLLTVPYAERIRLLGTVVKEKVGILTFCKRIKVNSSEHLVELLNQAIDARQEGVVIKKQDSVYSPNERNAGWYKIKPDYIDNLVTDFDLLIIGGYYNFRKTLVNTFLVGVLEKRPSSEDEQPVFLAVTKVSMGLTNDQLAQLNKSFQPHWRDVQSRKEGRSTVYEEPPELRWGETPPSVWLPPKHSTVLQLKGSELVRSSSYGTAYTIRFPRVMAVRDDKGYLDVCTKEEFDQLCSSSTTVAKLAKRYVTASDLISDTSPSRPANRKRKRPSPLSLRRSAKLPLEQREDEQPIDRICDGLDFCVASSSKGLPPVSELETMIRRHGGRVVKNAGPKTYAVVAGDRTFLVDKIIESGKQNVVSVGWLLRALGGSEPRNEPLLEFKPNDMLAITPALRERMADQFDRFGDSLTEKISGLDEMRDLLKQISVNDVQLSMTEVRQGQTEILGKKSSLRLFRGIAGRLYEQNLCDDTDRYKAQFRMLKFIRAGGRWVAPSSDDCVSHVFVCENEALDKSHLKQWLDSLAKQSLEPSILKIDWIESSLKQKAITDERSYRVF
ncbi:DNA ligase 4 isoform X2 [Sabethes cyaneus]|uniref:DNA ligase 4 isoform X2 n=1 Tax=Sabethes cyaneus TaxID=53552 RepID=UPI00237D98B0|nr:DNA ligase 4 isoform X2 [Sabethes cyaneus]